MQINSYSSDHSTSFRIDNSTECLIDATRHYITLLDTFNNNIRRVMSTGAKVSQCNLSKDLRSSVVHQDSAFTYIGQEHRYPVRGEDFDIVQVAIQANSNNSENIAQVNIQPAYPNNPEDSIKIVIFNNATQQIVRKIPIGSLLALKCPLPVFKDPANDYYNRFGWKHNIILCTSLPLDYFNKEELVKESAHFFTLLRDGRAAHWEDGKCIKAVVLPEQRFIAFAGIINGLFWICHQEYKKDLNYSVPIEIRYYDLKTFKQIGSIPLVQPGDVPVCSNKNLLFIFSQAQVQAFSLSKTGHKEEWRRSIFPLNVCRCVVNDDYLIVTADQFATYVTATWKVLDSAKGNDVKTFKLHQVEHGDAEIRLEGHHVVWVRNSTLFEAASKRILVTNLQTNDEVGNLEIHCNASLNGLKFASNGDLICRIDDRIYLMPSASDAHSTIHSVRAFKAIPLSQRRISYNRFIASLWNLICRIVACLKSALVSLSSLATKR